MKHSHRLKSVVSDIPDHADPNIMDWSYHAMYSELKKHQLRLEAWEETCRGKDCHNKPALK